MGEGRCTQWSPIHCTPVLHCLLGTPCTVSWYSLSLWGRLYTLHNGLWQHHHWTSLVSSLHLQAVETYRDRLVTSLTWKQTGINTFGCNASHYFKFSLNWPSGPIQSLSWNVRQLCVCVCHGGKPTFRWRVCCCSVRLWELCPDLSLSWLGYSLGRGSIKKHVFLSTSCG